MKVRLINGLAGTGKTTLAINSYDTRDSLFLAFTRNAAQAFAEKAELSDDSFSTIHSFVSPFAKKVLRNGKLRDNKAFNIYCDCIPDLKSDVPRADELLHKIWSYSLEKPHPVTIDYLHATRDKSDFVYNYEMLLVYGLYALRKLPDHHLSPRIKNLIVDEYQDVSRLQYEIIKELIREDTVENLIFLGDANQRIFEFAIGEFTLSKEIRKDFTDVEEETLTKDYRHTKELLSYIDIFAKDRCGRLAYEVPCSVKDAGGSVTFLSNISAAVEQFLSKGLTYKDITVISRTNRSCFNLARHIQEKLGYPVNVKFSVIDCILENLSQSLATYIKSGEFDDFIKFIALCRLTGFGFDRGIKARIRLDELTDGDKKLLEEIKARLDCAAAAIENGENTVKCLKSFKPLLDTFLYYANKDADTAEFIATTKEELNGENISYTLIAESLIRYYFADILSDAKAVRVDIKNDKNGICVSTVHRYKGLENKAVIFCPEYQTNSLVYSLSNENYESEENIIYTAVTRPLDRLCVVVNETLTSLHPSLYKLFPTVANMAECGLVDITDGGLSIPNSTLSWKDGKINGLDFTKYSLDRRVGREQFVLSLKEINGGKSFQLEFIKIGTENVCFSREV